MKLSSLLVVLSLLAASAVLHAVRADDKCAGDDSGRISSTRGTLVFSSEFALDKCGFQYLNKSLPAIVLKVGQLPVGATLTIGALNNDTNKLAFQAPVEPGLLAVPVGSFVRLQFGAQRKVTRIEYYPIDEVPLTEDSTSLYPSIVGKPVDIALLVSVVYSSKYVKLSGPRLPAIAKSSDYISISSGHALIPKSAQDVALKLKTDLTTVLQLKTINIRPDCSGAYTEIDSQASYNIEGPKPKGLANKYACVNLFSLTVSEQQPLHFELNFTNFRGLADRDDSLVVEGQDGERKLVTAINSNNVPGSLDYMKSSQIVVIYTSPYQVSPSDTGFKLTVQVAQYGGIVREGKLVFPVNQPSVTYVMRSQTPLVLHMPRVLSDANLVVQAGGQKFVFANGSLLPPVIPVDADTQGDVLLQFTSSDFKNLAGSYYADGESVIEKACHKLSTANEAVYSSLQVTGDCYWVVLSNSPIEFQLAYNVLNNDSAIDIHDLTYTEPVFERQSLAANELLPRFVLDYTNPGNYVHLKLRGTGNKVVAYHRTVESAYQKTRTVNAKTQYDLVSPNYPLAYSYIKFDQNYLINSTVGNYVISPKDIDIRQGESIAINGTVISNDIYKVVGDIYLQNVTVIPINLSRSSLGGDYSQKKGFAISVRRYDAIYQITVSNTARESQLTKGNETSIAVQLKARTVDQISAGRVALSFVAEDGKTNYEIQVSDSRLANTKTQIFYDSVRNESTSDTLSLVVNAKPNSLLPRFTIGYSLLPCKSDDYKCDGGTRCVPANKRCKGISYCEDKTDLTLDCTPSPIEPKVTRQGLGALGIFVVSVMMLIMGAAGALYGPDAYKYALARLRPNSYSTFTTAEG